MDGVSLERDSAAEPRSLRQQQQQRQQRGITRNEVAVTLALWDSLLSLTFFLQHSIMVRQPFRRFLAKYVVAPEYHGVIYTCTSDSLVHGGHVLAEIFRHCHVALELGPSRHFSCRVFPGASIRSALGGPISEIVGRVRSGPALTQTWPKKRKAATTRQDVVHHHERPVSLREASVLLLLPRTILVVPEPQSGPALVQCTLVALGGDGYNTRGVRPDEGVR